MKIKHIITLSLLVVVPLCATAQSSYRQTLESIVSRSMDLRSARATFSADSTGLRRGLNPEDPEASIDYFLGDGASFEMKVEQSFDFPTLYHQRNKISRLGISRAEYQLQQRRRELLLEASDLYITMVYNRSLSRLIEHRIESMQQMVSLSEKSVDLGESTVLELAKSKALLAEERAALRMARSAYDQASASLRKMNGGVEVTPTDYPTFEFTGSSDEFVAVAMASDFTIRQAEADSLIAARTLKLSRQEWIPKLKVGYRLDMDEGKARSAVAAGISIPLWQNRGNVRHAKAQIKASELSKAVTEENLRVSLSNLYNSYSATEQALADYGITDPNYADLLRKSYQGNGITSVEYLLSLSDWYGVEQKRVELEYSRVQLAATMSILLSE